MAELFDAASGHKLISLSGSGPYTASWTHTPINTPNAIIVSFSWSEGMLIDIYFVNGVTYGGVAMTYLGQGYAGNCLLEKFGILNPLPGPQTVQITYDSASPGDGIVLGSANSTSFYSTRALTAAFGTYFLSIDSTSPITNAVTGLSSENVIESGYLVYNGGSAAITLTINGTGETLRSGVTTQSGGGFLGRQTATSSQTSALGTVTASATISSSRSCAISSVEIREVPPGISMSQLLFCGI
jgi:hypothetical protein